MATAELLGPGWIPLWLAGIALIGLALLLAGLDIGNRAQRAFALLLTLRGLTFLIAPMRGEAEDVQASVLWTNLGVYAVLPLAPLAIYFVSLYPRPRGLAKTWWGRLALLGGTAAVVGLYLANHAAYATTTTAVPVRVDEYGPLVLLVGLRLPAFAFAGLVLALDYRRHPTGSSGFSLFLLVAGFTLNGLYDGTTAALNLFADLTGPPIDWLPWAWGLSILPVLALPLAVASCVALLPVLLRSRTDRELQEIGRFFFVAVPLAVLSGFAGLLGISRLDDLALGTWRLVLPLAATYALMRYQLFSIDIRLKAGVKRAILVALFVGVFFLISEAAEALVSADKAPLFGVVSASLLAVLGKPIQRLADRAANGVMPDTQPIEKLGSQARFQLYRDQFLLVQQDRRVSPKERRMLTRLAAVLTITEDEADDLELGEMPTRDEPAPPRPKRSASRIARSVVAVLGTAAVFGGVSAILEALANPSSFATGLVTAAFVALLLGPIESLSERLTRRRELNPAKEQAMRDALADAWADGNLSGRDEAFLAALQKRLGASKADRRRIEAEVLGPGAAPRPRRARPRPTPS